MRLLQLRCQFLLEDIGATTRIVILELIVAAGQEADPADELLSPRGAEEKVSVLNIQRTVSIGIAP